MSIPDAYEITPTLHGDDRGVFFEWYRHLRPVGLGALEEVAWRAGWIDDPQLRALALPLVKSGYGRYLTGLLEP